MYCLTAGKQYLPGQVASERQRRNLQKTDEEYRRRIELLQDFEFPEASQRVRLSDDGNFVLATGARARVRARRASAPRVRAPRSLGSAAFRDPGPLPIPDRARGRQGRTRRPRGSSTCASSRCAGSAG